MEGESGRAARVLVVEDDVLTQTILIDCLEEGGFLVSAAGTCQEMDAILATEALDLIVLDIGLLDADGLRALEEKEEPLPPVICVTASEMSEDRFRALEGVAVDYVTKPFEVREVLARVRNILDLRDNQQEDRALPVTRFEGFEVDFAEQTLLDPSGHRCDLTPAESKLISVLTRNPRQQISRDWLSRAVLGRPWEAEDRVIDILVTRLRKKLGGPEEGKRLIRSVRFVGYLLNADVS